MDIEILKDIGLTDAEIKIYIALLELGETSAGPLIKKTNSQNSVVHFTLNRLLKKGLISYIKKGNFRYYHAQSPESLIEFLDKKKENLNKILPKLIEKQKAFEAPEAEIYQGFRGFKVMLYNFIEDAKKGDEFLFFSFHSKNEKLMDKVFKFYSEFEKERVRFGIVTKGLISKEYKEKILTLRMPQYDKINFVDFPILNNISIFRNKIIMTPWDHTETSFLIKSEQLANNYREYFNSIWEKSVA